MSTLDTSPPVNTQQNVTGHGEVPQHVARLMRLATYASVLVACILIAAKFWAWRSTGSVSLLSTLIDSLLDMAASLINLFAVSHALEPADREHRFGHGKAESLAGLAQSIFITGSAAFLFYEAGVHLVDMREIKNTEIGFYVMGLSIGLTVLLVSFQHYVIAETKSVAIMADSLHYRMDILVNLGVIVSLALVSWLGWQWIDPLVAVLIAGYIVYGAWTIAKEAMHVLMDHELPDEDRSKIKHIALSHDCVLGVHDIRTRSSGLNVFIQLHLVLDCDITLVAAHEIADDVELLINTEFPSAQVLIHQDPSGLEENIPVFR